MSSKKQNKQIIFDVRPRATLLLKLTEKEYNTVCTIAKKRNTTPTIIIKSLLFDIYNNKNVTPSFRNRLKKEINQ